MTEASRGLALPAGLHPAEDLPAGRVAGSDHD
jgi:hypothetical protein